MAPEKSRPTGEQVLATLHTPQRPRLRIHIGAAPGVGKTYSMIDAAHAFRREGVDVVVGFVETHGRASRSADCSSRYDSAHARRSNDSRPCRSVARSMSPS